MTDITSLSFIKINQLDDLLLISIARHCVKLVNCEFIECNNPGITANGLKTFLRDCKVLTKFGLLDCEQFQNTHCPDIFSGSSNLTDLTLKSIYLTIGHCNSVLVSILKANPKLTHFYPIRWGKLENGEVANYLLENGRVLEVKYVSGFGDLV